MENNNKDNKSFAEKMGTALGYGVCVCATVCILAIMIVLTCKFILWII